MYGINVKDDILPAFVTLALIGVYSALLLTDREVPTHLETMVLAVVAFYFGGRLSGTATRNGAAAANTATILERSATHGGSVDG